MCVYMLSWVDTVIGEMGWLTVVSYIHISTYPVSPRRACHCTHPTVPGDRYSWVSTVTRTTWVRGVLLRHVHGQYCQVLHRGHVSMCTDTWTGDVAEPLTVRCLHIDIQVRVAHLDVSVSSTHYVWCCTLTGVMPKHHSHTRTEMVDTISSCVCVHAHS